MTETTTAHTLASETYMAIAECDLSKVPFESCWELTIGECRIVIGDEEFEDDPAAGWSWAEYMWDATLGDEGEWENVASGGCLTEDGPDAVRRVLADWARRAQLIAAEAK